MEISSQLHFFVIPFKAGYNCVKGLEIKPHIVSFKIKAHSINNKLYLLL